VVDTNISLKMSAANDIGGPANNAAKSIYGLGRAISETNSELKDLEKKQKSISRYRGLSDQVGETRREMESARLEVSRLRIAEVSASKVVRDHSKALKESERLLLSSASAYGAESAEVDSARKQVVRLTREKKSSERALKKELAAIKTAERQSEKLAKSYGKQSKELGGLRRDMSAAGFNLNALGAEELRLAKRTAGANKALERQSVNLKKVKDMQSRIDARRAKRGELAGEAVGVAASVAPLALAGRRSIEYEGVFADVKKQIDFSSEGEESKYRSEMLKLAGDLGVGQDGIAGIVSQAGQSGIEKSQLLEFATSATKMSVAWDVSSEDAGATLATWRASMGLTQEKALDLADATNYLSNNMNAKASEIASVLVREGSTAMGAGFSSNEVAALSSSLIAGGATGDTAATALKNISSALTAGYSATGGQKDALDRIGFDSDELAELMQEDAQATLVSVMRSLQEVSDAERGAVISELFGSEIKGAVSKLVANIDDDKNGLVASFSRVANEADRAGSVTDEYLNRSKTRGHALSQLSSKFDRMVITLGDRLLPVVDAIAPPLMSVVDGVSNFAEASPELASGLLAVGGALAVVKAGVIAFKLARLAAGAGADKVRLGRLKLSATTDRTALSANKANISLGRLNRQLLGLGAAGGVGSKSGDKKGKKGRKRKGKASSFGDFLSGGSGGLALAGAGVGAKAFKPVDIALQGAGLVSALAVGNKLAAAESAGDIAGGVGGAALGAALGSAILPGIGTIVGAGIGGFAGSELGGWVGESVAGWFSENKTDRPPSADVAQKSEALRGIENRINFAPVIQVSPSGNAAYDDSFSNDLVSKLKAEFVPLMVGGADVSIRSDASLFDRGDI